MLGLILVTSFVNPFMGSAVNLALPNISQEFGLNAMGMSWVAMAFLLASAVFMVPMGRLSDMFGRRKVFVLGNMVFALSTLTCAISPGGPVLILARLVQGIGGAMMFATNMAIVADIFPPGERGRAIGVNITAVYLGLALAPFLGGMLINAAGWRSIFYLTAIPVAAVAFLTHVLVKTEWKHPIRGGFDYAGAVTYVVAMSALMYGFSRLPGMWHTILTIGGLAGLVCFVRIERRTASPVFDVGLFISNRTFAFSNLSALINYAITFAVTFMLSLYLQYVKGLNPRDAGLVLVLQPALMALVASFSGRLSDRYDPRILASAGMAVITLGLAGLVPVGPETSKAYIMLVLGWMGIGFGLFSSPNTNAIMGSVEKNHLGLASATVGTMRLTGQMLSMGIATLVVHLFIGQSPLHAGNLNAFLQAQKVLFLVFVVLGIAGTVTSLAGAKPGSRIKKVRE